VSDFVRDLDHAIADARFVAFAVARAESQLGLTVKGIPFMSRLKAILEAGMAEPAAIDPALYQMVWMLHAPSKEA
jgi:hypothetical protein